MLTAPLTDLPMSVNNNSIPVIRRKALGSSLIFLFLSTPISNQIVLVLPSKPVEFSPSSCYLCPSHPFLSSTWVIPKAFCLLTLASSTASDAMKTYIKSGLSSTQNSPEGPHFSKRKSQIPQNTLQDPVLPSLYILGLVFYAPLPLLQPP